MADLIKSVLDDFLSGKILGSFSSSWDRQKCHIQWVHMIFVKSLNKNLKNKIMTETLILDLFGELEVHTQGEKMFPNLFCIMDFWRT